MYFTAVLLRAALLRAFVSELMAKIIAPLRHTGEQGKDDGVQQS